MADLQVNGRRRLRWRNPTDRRLRDLRIWPRIRRNFIRSPRSAAFPARASPFRSVRATRRPRIAETPSGMLNAGRPAEPRRRSLSSREDLPWLRQQGTARHREYRGQHAGRITARMAEKLSETDVDMVEIEHLLSRTSSTGGVASSGPPARVSDAITAAVRKHCQQAADGQAVPQRCRYRRDRRRGGSRQARTRSPSSTRSRACALTSARAARFIRNNTGGPARPGGIPGRRAHGVAGGPARQGPGRRPRRHQRPGRTPWRCCLPARRPCRSALLCLQTRMRPSKILDGLNRYLDEHSHCFCD